MSCFRVNYLYGEGMCNKEFDTKLAAESFIIDIKIRPYHLFVGVEKISEDGTVICGLGTQWTVKILEYDDSGGIEK